MAKIRAVAVAVVLLLVASVFLHAQGFRRFFLQQNDPPKTELVVARWHFGTNGNIGHMGWSHNYPNSDQHINQLIMEATDVEVDRMSYRIVELGSPEVFRYPFAYVSEPGEMELSEKEVVNFREYINRGGFVLVDDFDGPWQMAQFRRQVQRAFPGRQLIPLTIDHPIFNIFFDIDGLNIVSPYLVGGDPVFYGLPAGRGDDIGMIICFNNDLANFWDWIDRPVYPLKPSIEAFRLGINFVVYAMTH
jgi:hypothetical protein